MSGSVANLPITNKPKLLDEVRDVIRRKHYSIRTEQAYVDWIKRFIIYHDKRHPAEMAEDEVTKFLTHLARDRHVAPSTQNQARKSLPRPTRLGSRAKAKDYFTCTTFTCCAQ